MPDRDKIIKGLECCQTSMSEEDPFAMCEECPYNDISLYVDCCRSVLCKDAVELLRKSHPPRESKAMVPCKCGCKRREHWYAPSNKETPEFLKCMRCGFEVYGKNATDVIRKWNEAVKRDD